MRGTSGLLLIGIGCLHTAYGTLQAYGILSQIGGATFPNEISRQVVTGLGKNYVFWFLFAGFMMIVLGHLLAWMERRLKRPVPAFMGWELLLLSVVGVAILPRSGFWLILALSLYILVATRQSAGRASGLHSGAALGATIETTRP